MAERQGQREFDIVVLGMGPGGEYAARELAKSGLSVAGVEARLVGGECPYWGCVPSKMMIRAANLLSEGRRIPGMAGASVVSPDWALVADRIRAEATDDWDDTAAADRFTRAGGTLFRGYGRITGPGEVTVRGNVLRARRGIVINTGTAPAVPPIPGLAGTPFWTNREIVETEDVPQSLAVLGGGAIGSELAQVFARFGARVTVAEAADRLLPMEEPESGELLAKIFTSEGITVSTGAKAESVTHDAGGFTLKLADGSQVQAERLLLATGRTTNLAAVGISAVGLDESARSIPVDDEMRAAPGVWAIGDVTGHGAFTHMSMYQAQIAVDAILGRPHHPAEYHAVPRVTFTDPEIGGVGLTAAEARERLGNVATGISQVPASSRGWIHKAGNAGFIKLVADAGRGVLVGATSAGPVGGEVLSMLTLAVHAEVPVRRLTEMIYAYPTFHRAVRDALEQLS
ncbi:MAG TPA: NAD(P)/FAD-dependent oxidoreductase [Streptosporangiaceae bacterium]|nr:NAD(P)/FAD-dependent oxidoreductase [Streptosporangiaceae bacterium]